MRGSAGEVFFCTGRENKTNKARATDAWLQTQAGVWPMLPRVCPGTCKRDRHCNMAPPVHARLPYVQQMHVLRRTCLASQSNCSSHNTACFVLQQRAGSAARSACLWDFSPLKPQGFSARAGIPGRSLLPSMYQQCNQSMCRAQHAKYSV
jgi:hypothetical protein